MIRSLAVLGLLFGYGLPALAEVKSKTIAYKDGDLELEGYFAWDDSVAGKRPAVLVVHEWWGLDDYARRRADMLAKMGYAAFACDMYGKGQKAEHPQEAGQMASKVRANKDAWRKRGLAGLETLKAQPQTDARRIAAIGYCFGGSTVLQLAFTSADLKAIASFHGAIQVPTAEEAKAIKAKVLICHGAQDNFIPEQALQNFRTAMDEGKADWQMVYYSGAKHSFTVKEADAHNVEGLKYDAHADARSWKHLRILLDEAFAKGE